MEEYVKLVPAIKHAAQCFDIPGGAIEEGDGTIETFVLDGEDSLSQASRFWPKGRRPRTL